MSLIEKIKHTAPLAYNELKDYYITKFPELNSFSIDSLQFELLIGICIGFFNEQKLELSVTDIEPNTLSDAILEVFVGFEKTISHYS
jgi:RNA processing factor Prp31